MNTTTMHHIAEWAGNLMRGSVSSAVANTLLRPMGWLKRLGMGDGDPGFLSVKTSVYIMKNLFVRALRGCHQKLNRQTQFP